MGNGYWLTKGCYMRTLKTRFKRLLRLHDLEFFKIVMSDEEQAAYLLIHDGRPRSNEIDGNRISTYLISNFELSDSSYQDVLNFNDDLLGMKHNCSYFMDSLRVEKEFDFDFPFDMLAIRNYVQEILSTLGIDTKLPDIKETDFNYLSQE